jgi:hypothetical protein
MSSWFLPLKSIFLKILLLSFKNCRMVLVDDLFVVQKNRVSFLNFLIFVVVSGIVKSPQKAPITDKSHSS